ncbi:unnamed protein product [Ectocarpus sp. 12 AP-2014]
MDGGGWWLVLPRGRRKPTTAETVDDNHATAFETPEVMADGKALEMLSQLRRNLRDILMQRWAVGEDRAKSAQAELAALAEEFTLHLVLGAKPGCVLPTQPKKVC